MDILYIPVLALIGIAVAMAIGMGIYLIISQVRLNRIKKTIDNIIDRIGK